MTRVSRLRPLLLLPLALLLGACGGDNVKPTLPAATAVAPVRVPPVKVGIALGGGAAKGFAHIGVIKMLEANGIQPVVVSGTSAGSVVGALYASGMDAFQMQKVAFALDEDRIRDVSLFSGGVVKGQKLQDYVNELVAQRKLEAMKRPLAVVATRLEDGERTVFVRGNTGQAVRASSSIPGVFEAVVIGKAGRHIPVESALDHVFGYINFIDGSARGLPPPGNVFFQMKSRDTFAPIGPCIVTADEIDEITAAVDGALTAVFG